MILNDFTLHIHRGEKVALVGVSGCGKSTVSKLTMGFYKSEAGHVRINGVDIEDMPVDELRTIMAYVPQDTFLMSSSIRDNLLLGNKEIIPDTDLLSLKYKCGCQFVDELPFGFDTMLDENGANLSGGQRQRLAIVRALLRHPQILMLDEATSNLDATSEYELIQVIKQLDPSLTIITIAHRLNTIRDSDCIFVLEDGAVMEYGTHETLIQANTQYAHLWSCQSL